MTFPQPIYPGYIASGGGYSTNAGQFIARLANDPGTTRKNAYAAIIDGLTSAGLWSKFDALYIFAADTANNANINLISSSFTASVAAGSPTFSSNNGYSGDGSNYITTNFNPSSSSYNYKVSSAHISGWSKTTASSTLASFDQANDQPHDCIYFQYTGGSAYVRINGAGSGFTVSDASGFLSGSYSGSGSTTYKNGASIGTTTYSSSLKNANWDVAKSSHVLALASFGGAMSDTDMSNFYSVINTNKWW